MTPVPLVVPIASYPPCLGVEFKNNEQVPQVSLIDMVIQEVEEAMVNKDPLDFYFSIVGILIFRISQTEHIYEKSGV